MWKYSPLPPPLFGLGRHTHNVRRDHEAVERDAAGHDAYAAIDTAASAAPHDDRSVDRKLALPGLQSIKAAERHGARGE